MMILFRSGLKVMLLGWAATAVRFLLPGQAGWATPLVWATFGSSLWLLFLGLAFGWRDHRRELARGRREVLECSANDDGPWWPQQGAGA